MNREDVKIGEKYKVVGKRDYDFEEGEIITISSPYTGDDNWFRTKERGIIIHCSNFESINKFEVGDEVLWKNNRVEIWGKRYDKDLKDYEYAVINLETFKRQMVWENDLSPLKKKDELEVGDKFKSNMGNEVEVLAVGKDEDKTYYLGKLEMGVVAFSANDIKEIVYD